MSMQDPLADMFTRIRNAQSRHKDKVGMPSSKKKLALAKVLKDEGFVSDFETNSVEGKMELQITLKYYDGRGVIESIQRISKPGLRVYRSKSDLPKVIGGLGVAVVSTSLGLLSDREARAKGVGGEIVCAVY